MRSRSVLLLLFVLACRGESAVSTPEDDAQISATPEEIPLSFSFDDGYFVSPLAEGAPDSTAVALFVTFGSASGSLSADARALNAGNPGPWVPLAVVWSETPLEVLRAEVGPFEQFQIRIAEDALSHLARLTWAAGVTAEPADVGSTASGLASFLSPLGIETRAAWGAVSGSGCASEGSKHRMAIHHTTGPLVHSVGYESYLRGVQAFHMRGRGWCDIAYHFLVSADGRLWEGRPLHLRGGHTRNNNTGNIGVAFIGCFQPGACNSASTGSLVPPEVMIDRTRELVHGLADQYSIAVNANTVKGHRQHSGQSTSCPGDNLLARMSDIFAPPSSGPPSIAPPNGRPLCAGASRCSTLVTIDAAGGFAIFAQAAAGSDRVEFTFGDAGDVPLVGDWNCDGERTPGVYRRSTNTIHLRNSNGAGTADLSFELGNAGDVRLAGDFDGDGCDTVSLFRPSEGRFYVKNTLASGAADHAFYFGDAGDVPFVGDFDGDGVDTFGLHRKRTSQIFLRNSNSTGNADVSLTFGNPNDVVFAGDWDGDGDDTVALHRPGDGRVHLRNSNSTGSADYDFHLGSPRHLAVGTTASAAPPIARDSVVVMSESGTFRVYAEVSAGSAVTEFVFGDPGDVPLMGDWNCDGERTAGVYRPSNNTVYLRNSNSTGAADISFELGDAGDVRVAGDFDGDGCDTVSIYRPSEARFYVKNSLASGAADHAFYFGDLGDTPFAGDFDGDGVDTFGLHRKSTGQIFLRNSNSTGNADVSLTFGDPNDLVFAGDWDGDGDDTVALYRRSNGTLYLRNHNSTGTADRDLRVGAHSMAARTGRASSR